MGILFAQVYKTWKKISDSTTQPKAKGGASKQDVLPTLEDLCLESLFDSVGSHVSESELKSYVDLHQESLERINEDYTAHCKQEDIPQMPIYPSYIPVTKEVDLLDACSLLKVAEEASCGKFQCCKPSCLVGLHTCGDLASTLLQLFCHLPSVKAVCMVGCCYNHITEACDCSSNTSKYYDDHTSKTMLYLNIFIS